MLAGDSSPCKPLRQLLNARVPLPSPGSLPAAWHAASAPSCPCHRREPMCVICPCGRTSPRTHAPRSLLLLVAVAAKRHLGEVLSLAHSPLRERHPTSGCAVVIPCLAARCPPAARRRVSKPCVHTRMCVGPPACTLDEREIEREPCICCRALRHPAPR